MSALATTYIVRRNDLNEVRSSARPKRGLLGPKRDNFHGTLERLSARTAMFQDSEYALPALLAFVDERSLPVYHEEFDELSQHLTDQRQASSFILAPAADSQVLDTLNPDAYDTEQLADYYDQLMGDSPRSAGQSMLDALCFLRDSVQACEPDHVVLLIVG